MCLNFKVFFAITLSVVIFVLTGCTSNAITEQTPPKDVRILMGSVGIMDYTLIEFEHPNTFRFTSFGGLSHTTNDATAVFDMALLHDFLSKAPEIEYTLLIFQSFDYLIIDEWTIELSSEQLINIHELLENLARRRADREFEPLPALGWIPYVWAIIDGNMYWTLYTHDVGSRTARERQRYINQDLLAFSYELINLSPSRFQRWATPNSEN